VVIYEAGEQRREGTIRKFRIVQKEGNRDVARNVDFYNLDTIIAVGFRVNSARAVQFRQWATGVLREAMKPQRWQTGEPLRQAFRRYVSLNATIGQMREIEA